MKIKNILFDMGGVIFTQDTPEAIRRFSAAGIDTDYYMGQYGQKDFFLSLELGYIDTAEFCRRMAAASGRESVSYGEASYCWLGFIKGVETARLRNLEKLRGRYHLGMLSNTNPFVMEYMDSPQMSEEGRPISHYFDSLFCSYTMGICKPDARIYEKALAADSMNPEETLFVDDSLKNIEAAEALGIRGLHVATNEDWMPRLAEMLGR